MFEFICTGNIFKHTKKQRNQSVKLYILLYVFLFNSIVSTIIVKNCAY